MWKELTKRFSSPDSFVSLILGLAVVIVIGAFAYRFLTGKTATAPSKESEKSAAEQKATLPTTHAVASGETLWSISETYYKSGYNWVSIRDANKLANADYIEVGQNLTIPDVAPIFPPGQISAASTVAKPQTYTVVRGDTLWSVAVKFYGGDGYQWVKIAQTNSLANPDLIHAGNVLTLP